MISNKITRELLRLEKKSIKKDSDEHYDVEYLSIFLMSVVDRYLCGNYVKANSMDDAAFLTFLETGQYSKFDAYVDRGLIRASIARPIRNKVMYMSSSTWNSVVLECLFLLNKIVPINENLMVLKDAELQGFFEFKEAGVF